MSRREQAPRDDAAFDAEQEIDLAHYWRALAARWWLPLLGLVLGILLGYLLAFGGKEVWRARALVYLGQPLTPSGAQVSSLNTNPTTVTEILRSDEAIERVARDVGLEPGKLRAGVTSQTVQGNVARLGHSPLVRIVVRGDQRRKVTAASNALASHVIDRVSGYADTKIETLEEQVAADQSELERIDERIERIEEALGSGASSEIAAISLVGFAEQRRSVVLEDLRTVRQLLALARDVERARIIERGVARKTTARSPRNSMLVGGVLGLLFGSIAALLWAPLAGAARRRV